MRGTPKGRSGPGGLEGAVKTIKTAILKSRYLAARKANAEMLKLYFNVGAYVSAHSRAGTWGTGAIEAISERLSLELPGLRGFSPVNIKNMRIFYERWGKCPNRQPAVGDSKIDVDAVPQIRQLATDDLNESDLAAFFCVGFTQHMAILYGCTSVPERWYNTIHQMLCY